MHNSEKYLSFQESSEHSKYSGLCPYAVKGLCQKAYLLLSSLVTGSLKRVCGLGDYRKWNKHIITSLQTKPYELPTIVF